MTVQKLQSLLGLKVKVRHNRWFSKTWGDRDQHTILFTGSRHDYKSSKLIPEGRGGTTVVTIHEPDGTFLARGEAKCSRLDNFNRKMGTQIALGRAWAEINGEAERRRRRG